MSGILLVERSTTLSHLLRRTLAAAALPVRAEIGNYLEAHDHLRRIGRPNSKDPPYALAIIGAPARATREYQALLEFARHAPDAPATLLMAHEETAEIRTWAATTMRGRFLLWSQFSRIPACVAELAPEEVVTESPAIETGTRVRILFVDDSRSVCQAYSDLLGRNGYAVDVADSIGEAEQKVAENAYDIVIVDYFLPDGSGDELCRRLGEREDPPILAVITGSYREDIIRRCLQAGASECMFKNEARELFLARVRTLARTIEMRKSAEAEREQLDGILGSVGDGVFGVDGDGRITFVNPTGLRLLGYGDDSDLIGLLAQAAIHPQESPRSSPLSRAYSEGVAVHHIENMFRRRDGSGVPVEYTVLPLAGSGQGAVVIFRDIAERRTAERLRWELSHDPLTGLPNARHLRQRLIAELARLRDRGGYSALIHIELDRDDRHEPPRGDELLRTVAHALAHRLREGDVLARGEGDSFLLLLSTVQVDNIDVLADSFRQLLAEREYAVGEVQHKVHARIGAELLSPRTVTADEALAHARAAADSGRERAVEAQQAAPNTSVEAPSPAPVSAPSERLRLALEQARFVILVQPLVAIEGLPRASAVGENVGWQLDKSELEPLFAVQLRMVGKDGQLIQPRAFIPLAERVGMVQRIDLWVVNGLLMHLANERARHAPVGLIARLSPATIADPDSLAAIEKSIVSTGVPAERLIFEISDSPELANLPAALHFITRLRAIGCRFVLNGVDTEAGLLPFLHSLRRPGDFLRIDRNVVGRMTTAAADRDLVVSIATLARSMQMQSIAGEVEDDATLQALQEAAVDYVQGRRLGEARLIKRVDFSKLLALT
ncbi:GGDEF domain-containing response regulator [Dokdonella immobilis]|uniref:PAS domain S-box-containing protein/diguanylate cyclase (GGDEF) domain-containing protein n=1 Tax=Dokdonella immobilis TaxID=578942 RepID=A0A1I4XV75_9GAMM|nr:GGDEF domain-containing response regulator [Dokdonella immobilis]SFN29293.1 PAS domain S-box-containing protein/diguanylate cyclase (GGDEF) domain-containing protein [Dokdonella immobilis]